MCIEKREKIAVMKYLLKLAKKDSNHRAVNHCKKELIKLEK